LEWGNSEIYIKAVEKITSPPNDFYRALGKGCAYASDIYGGKDFALTFGKNEMPGYHTGPVAYLGFLLGCRHSHLDNAGYSIDQKELMGKTLSPSEIVDKIIDEEQWRQILSSLVICFFSRGIYTPDLVREALGLSGFSKSNAEINNISKIIYKEKFQFKLREGFSFDNLEMPKRIFETPSPSMPFDQNFIRDAIQYAKKTILKKHS
jgi:aldehyde:ferredoxin oxidoreductase